MISAALLISSDEVRDPSFVMSDFGAAWLSDTETREDLYTPVVFLPPEATFATKVEDAVELVDTSS